MFAKRKKITFSLKRENYENIPDWIGYAFYSTNYLSSKNKIGYRIALTFESYNGFTHTITVPNNDAIKYIGISGRFIGLPNSDVQLEEGTEATPYVPHTVSATKVVRTTNDPSNVITVWEKEW